LGFQHTGTSWNMSKALLDLEAPSWPTGLGLRPEDDAHLEQVWQVISRAFAGTGFSRERTFEEWKRQVLRDADVISAWDGDVLVGVATHELRLGAGYIGQLAVLPSHRGIGLGRALLREAFSRDLARGLSETKLVVDGLNETARGLYEGVGMVVEQEYRKWEKCL
ncbi:MAG: family N-acetyltransferase, partial [Frankiales bacterium]|nr:family N-acetyltransferase [Frankiales bacterium]